jgi:hypothetical protein
LAIGVSLKVMGFTGASVTDSVRRSAEAAEPRALAFAEGLAGVAPHAELLRTGHRNVLGQCCTGTLTLKGRPRPAL